MTSEALIDQLSEGQNSLNSFAVLQSCFLFISTTEKRLPVSGFKYTNEQSDVTSLHFFLVLHGHKMLH